MVHERGAQNLEIDRTFVNVYTFGEHVNFKATLAIYGVLLPNKTLLYGKLFSYL